MKKLILSGIFTICICLGLFSQTTITINPATTYQTIRGFGGSGHMTSGYDTYLRNVVDLMGITAFRLFAEDYETSGATITPAEINSGTFSFTFGNALADFYKALKAKGVTMIVANFGSPPASLKKNNCLSQKWGGICGGSPCGTYNCPDPDNYLLSEYYDEDAKYKANWVKDFETKTTQTLYGFGIDNEPLFNEPYPSTILNAQNYGPSLQAIRTAFDSAGLTHIKFYGPEHMGSYLRNSGGDGVVSEYIQNLLWSPTYRSLLDAYAVHGYTDGIAYDLGSAPSWAALDTSVRKWNKELWMTECGFGGTCNWNLFFDIVTAQYAALKYGKVNVWLTWSMNYSDGMFVGGSATPKLYALMHFFRFIRPGYQQIECTEGDADVAAIAFKNGSDFTVVALNKSTTNTKTITFNDFTGKPAYFDMYRSMNRNATELEKCAYVGRLTGNSFDLPAKSVATLYFKSSEPTVYWGVNPPTGLAASSIADNSFKVTWTAAPNWILAGSPVNVTGYVVYINGVKKTMSPTTATTYTFSGLTKNTAYTVEVYARDAMYNESVAAKIVVNTTCSTNDCGPAPGDLKDEGLSISVSPNPASNQITIGLPDENLYTVSLVNLSGNTVIQKQARNNDRIEIDGLANGIYIVIARNENKILQIKIAIE